MDRVVGAAGAIDGLFVDVIAPSTSECLGNQLSYSSGAKKGYGINVHAMETAKYRFSGVIVNHPGATNDFGAYTHPFASSRSDSRPALPGGFYILGDDAAYPLSEKEKLLTPYAGRGLSEE